MRSATFSAAATRTWWAVLRDIFPAACGYTGNAPRCNDHLPLHGPGSMWEPVPVASAIVLGISGPIPCSTGWTRRRELPRPVAAGGSIMRSRELSPTVPPSWVAVTTLSACSGIWNMPAIRISNSTWRPRHWSPGDISCLSFPMPSARPRVSSGVSGWAGRSPGICTCRPPTTSPRPWPNAACARSHSGSAGCTDRATSPPLFTLPCSGWRRTRGYRGCPPGRRVGAGCVAAARWCWQRHFFWRPQRWISRCSRCFMVDAARMPFGWSPERRSERLGRSSCHADRAVMRIGPLSRLVPYVVARVSGRGPPESSALGAASSRQSRTRPTMKIPMKKNSNGSRIICAPSGRGEPARPHCAGQPQVPTLLRNTSHLTSDPGDAVTHVEVVGDVLPIRWRQRPGCRTVRIIQRQRGSFRHKEAERAVGVTPGCRRPPNLSG